jgi:hypothetical protein
MENISRGTTLGDFVTILAERSMQNVTVERSQIIFTVIAITRKKFSINNNDPCRHNKGTICAININ